MGIGLLAGAGIGAAVGAIMDCDEALWGEPESVCVGVVAFVDAGTELLLGTAIGFSIRTDRWEEVPLDQLRVSVVPQHDGVALAISVAF
jgi:hypothetical protein